MTDILLKVAVGVMMIVIPVLSITAAWRETARARRLAVETKAIAADLAKTVDVVAADLAKTVDNVQEMTVKNLDDLRRRLTLIETYLAMGHAGPGGQNAG